MLDSRLGPWAVLVLAACGATDDREVGVAPRADAGDASASSPLSCHAPTENVTDGCPRTWREGAGLACRGEPMRCDYPYSGDTNPAAGRPCPGFARLNCSITPNEDGGGVGRWTVEMSARAGSEPLAE